MWLKWFLVVFLSANHLAYSYNFGEEDTDLNSGPYADWDYVDNPLPRAYDDRGDKFVSKFKSQASVSATPYPPPLTLPESVPVPAKMLYKALFVPGMGSSTPMSPLVKSILLPEKKSPAKSSSGFKMVEVLCFLDRMHVRVLKSSFSNQNARNLLKLGTCSVSNVSKTHFHFMYFLKECGLKRAEDADRVLYSNTLVYKPAITGMVVREVPFTLDIQCSYAKFHRSYRRGFVPHVAGGTLFRGLETRKLPKLVAMTESWKLLPLKDSFALGKPICFEATGSITGKGKRLYLNTCYVTSTPNPLLSDKYSVIENQGCLVDSKNSAQTRFYTGPNKLALRFCVAAFLFKNIASQPEPKTTMFMHCELDIGPETPTSSAKACTYNTQTQKWTELFGDSSVCNCCESTCSPSSRASGKSLITSESWNLKIGKETSPLSPEKTNPEFPVDEFPSFWESDS